MTIVKAAAPYWAPLHSSDEQDRQLSNGRSLQWSSACLGVRAQKRFTDSTGSFPASSCWWKIGEKKTNMLQLNFKMRLTQRTHFLVISLWLKKWEKKRAQTFEFIKLNLILPINMENYCHYFNLLLIFNVNVKQIQQNKIKSYNFKILTYAWY